MLNYLKSKIVISFAIFGAVLALVLGLISRVSVLWLVVRVLAGGLLMGSLGFGLDFFLRQSLSPEDYEELFRKKTPAEPVAPENPGVDVVDEPGMSPDQAYTSLYKEQDAETPASPRSPDRQAPGTGHDSSGSSSAAGPSPDSFQPDDVESIPRVAQKMSEEIEAPSGPSSANPDDLSREEKVKRAFAERSVSAAGDPSVKFKMGAKSVTADPKVIAKAIRTVLQRDK